jgi:AcrR family transcriptional regulator
VTKAIVGTTRRQRIIETTREEILLSAARLLAAGPKAISLADIAHEIGLTAPALYAYFDSKQAIFTALVRLLDVEIDAVFAARPRDDRHTSFKERLLELSRRHLAVSERRREVFMALFALRMRGEEVEAMAGRPPPPMAHFARLTAWFRREAGPSDLHGQTPEDLATVFFGLHHGFFMRWMLGGSEGSLATDAERLVDFFFHGIGEPAARQPVRRPRSGRRQPR